MDGIIPLWKPKGFTSHDCVAKIRGIYSTKKVGHTGTLDPEVEGVLPICIGQATRIVPYLVKTKKMYDAQVQLGIATETEDAYGKIIEEVEIDQFPTLQEIDQALKTFQGTITQIPPMYSAVRVKGKRLYEYALANESVERPKRQVTIHSIERRSKLLNDQTAFNIRVVCSQGTYIRTLCVDIGKKLGYPAHMSYLVRNGSSSFTVEDTITFSEIERAKQNNRLHETIVPMLDGLKHLARIDVDEVAEKKISHGQRLKKPRELMDETKHIAMVYNDELIAIYKVDQNNPKAIRPVRVFNTK